MVRAKAFKMYERFQSSIDQGFILFLGLTLNANEAFNYNGAPGKMVSIRNIQDMWWYWIKRDGKMQKIFYETDVFKECNSTCQSRLRIDGATLELMAVREEDRGLQLKCRLFPKFQVSRQVYKMKISGELPKGQCNLRHSHHGYQFVFCYSYSYSLCFSLFFLLIQSLESRVKTQEFRVEGQEFRVQSSESGPGFRLCRKIATIKKKKKKTI